MNQQTRHRRELHLGTAAFAILVAACQSVIPATSSPRSSSALATAQPTSRPAPTTLRPTNEPIATLPAFAPWTQLPSISQPRRDHTATALATGEILVVGGVQRLLSPAGEEQWESLSSVELAPPDRSHWRLMNPLTDARSGHSAVLLDDGRVLVYGGHRVTAAGAAEPVSTAEVWDPESWRWRVIDGPATQPNVRNPVRLPDGRQLLVGLKGTDLGPYQLRAEIFDPETNAWERGPIGPEGRWLPAAALLPDGRILVAGGAHIVFDGPPNPTSDAWFYDPTGGSWRSAPPLPEPIYDGRAVVLRDQRVAILAEGSTQIYNPATNAWSVAAAPASFRTGAAALLLQDGRVLSVGSGACIEGPEIAEIFDPVANSWIPAGALPYTAYIAAVVQPDRRVVVIGGGPPCGRTSEVGPSPDVFLLDPAPMH